MFVMGYIIFELVKKVLHRICYEKKILVPTRFSSTEPDIEVAVEPHKIGSGSHCILNLVW